MFRHIRSKLIAALAVPLAILVAVAGLQAASSLKQINSVDQQTALASGSVGPGGAVQDLQIERMYAVLAVIGHGRAVSPALSGVGPSQVGLDQSPAQVEQATDAAVSSFQQAVNRSGAQAQADFAGAIAQLGDLASARRAWAVAATGKQVPDYATVATRTYNAYTAIIDGLINATAALPQQVSDSTLRSGVEILYASLQKAESQYQFLQELFVRSWSAAPAARAAEDNAYADWGADQSLARTISSFASGPYAQAVSTLAGGPIDAHIGSAVHQLQAGVSPSLNGLLSYFSQAASAGKSDTALADTEIASVLNARASALHSQAVEKSLLFSGVGLVGILLGLGLVILVSRSISRPLVDLAEQAQRLATETLPVTVQAILDAGASGSDPPRAPQVIISSHDEVALMGKALEAVNRTAVELAVGQAALRKSLAEAFVNLGRRNQNLVTRQLEYISEIEIKEADPESLEELFRLDHLATRMRRNAESLLILAGSGPARQWSAAVPAMDVARAASAEVEDYKRLRLHHFDQAMVTGAVTTDLVHIMAELTENALSFSPPGSPVDIYGRFLDGAYVIVIVDSGIGMSAADLEVANTRLSGEGSDSDVPGRYLGHFVAGRLARRHGIAITLQASHSGGLVARVRIPATLIEDPVPDLSAVAEVRTSHDGPSVPAGPGTADYDEDNAVGVPPLSYEPAPGQPSIPIDPTDLLNALRAATGGGDENYDSRPGLDSYTPASPEAYPDGYATNEYAANDYGTGEYGPSAYAPDAYAPDAYAHDAYGSDTYGTDTYAPDTYAPDTYGSGDNGTSAYDAGAGLPDDNEAGHGQGGGYAGFVGDYGARADAPPAADLGTGTNGTGTNGTDPNGSGTNGYGTDRYQDAEAETAALGGPVPDWSDISVGAWSFQPEPEDGTDNGTAPAVDGAPTPPWHTLAPATPGPARASGPSALAPSPVAPAADEAGPADAADELLGQGYDLDPAYLERELDAGPASAGPPTPAYSPGHLDIPVDEALLLPPPAGAPATVAAPTTNAPAPSRPPAALAPTAPAVPGSTAAAVPAATAAAVPAPAVTPSSPPPPAAPRPKAPGAAAPAPTAPAPSAVPVPSVASVAPVAPVAAAAPPRAHATPDLGARSPLVAGTTPAASRPPAPPAPAPSWDPVSTLGAPNSVGPAAQARSTADGLRKLTRRVPGASLPQEDDSLRRATPTTTGRNPLGLTGALSQYLSATSTGDGRTDKEQNAR